MKYEWVLFDADDTLFHFDAFKGLVLMFSKYGIEFTIEDFAAYQVVNHQLWIDYQDGKITAQTLQNTRFQTWAERLNVTTQELNLAFLSAMADICQFMPGAENLLKALSQHAKLGIITNGFSALQRVRLERMKVESYISVLVISEEVGVAKPDPKIFERAFEMMDYYDKHKILMVGDNAQSDILGGQNIGIDTCWLNTKNLPLPENVSPTHIVSQLSELQELILPF